MSATAWASVRGPPGGMLPPYQVKQEPLLTRGELAPLMYRWLESQEYDPEADPIWPWQRVQLPVVKFPRYLLKIWDQVGVAEVAPLLEPDPALPLELPPFAGPPLELLPEPPLDEEEGDPESRRAPELLPLGAES